MKLTIHTDGACLFNGSSGSHGGAGFVIQDEAGTVVLAGHKVLPRGCTNNDAEYVAVCEALIRAGQFKPTSIELRTDSKLVVEQYYGRWACRSHNLWDWLTWLKETAATLSVPVTLVWISREKNEAADYQSKLALAESLGEDIDLIEQRLHQQQLRHEQMKREGGGRRQLVQPTRG